VLGNNRLRVLPVWELKFGTMGGHAIATEKVKHDPGYQERVGISDGPAENLAPQARARIQQTAKRIYRTLGLDGYARIDFRLAADGALYFIEANPNPQIVEADVFAAAARHDGLDYPSLLQRILALGISRGKRRRIRRPPDFNRGSRCGNDSRSPSLNCHESNIFEH
jgi:D-alanine-D-alanine ligase